MFSLILETTQKSSNTDYAKGKFVTANIRYAVKVNERRGGNTPHTLYLGTWLKGMFKFDMVEKWKNSVLREVSGSNSCIAEDSSLLRCYTVSIGSYRCFGVLDCITAKMKVIWSYKKFVNTNRHGVTYQKTRMLIYIFVGNNYFIWPFIR
jgi:hypothetical protein